MKSFVLIYHRESGALDVEEYGEGDSHIAFKRRLTLDRQFIDDQDVEIVVFEAESLHELKQSHARYFQTLHEIRDEFRRQI